MSYITFIHKKVINVETHRLPSKRGGGPFVSLEFVGFGPLLLQLGHVHVL